MSLKLPTWATTALSLVAGALTVLNQTTFDLGSPWKVGLSVALVYLTGLGISPLVGNAFRNALGLSHGASVAISAVLSAAVLIITSVHMSTGLHAALVGIITVLAGVGFGPALAPTRRALGNPAE